MHYYQLRIETDDDFSVEFKGQLLVGHEIELVVRRLDELDTLQVLGPWGSPATMNTKRFEFDEGLTAVRKNPDEPFSNTGGNRGIEWEPIDAAEFIRGRVPTEFQYLFPYRAGDTLGDRELLDLDLAATRLLGSLSAYVHSKFAATCSELHHQRDL